MAWNRMYLTRPRNNEFLLALMENDETNPPKTRATSVKPLCTVACRLESRFEDWPVFYGKDGKTYRVLEFEVQMTSDGGSLEFEAFQDGKRLGRERVAVNFL